MTALDDIKAERQRQINVEGWTHEHDDTHTDCSLAAAAYCYALSASIAAEYPRQYFMEDKPDGWPWAVQSWKPKTRREDLVKAGALIIAEIERIDRRAAMAT